MGSRRPGAVMQRLQSKYGVRRGHVVRVDHLGATHTISSTGVYSHATAQGWLHLKHGEGAAVIHIDRIVAMQEIDTDD